MTEPPTGGVATATSESGSDQVPLKDDPTEEQKVIIDQPADARVLVTAGPGTGKTHVLVHRIARLIQAHDLAPGSELLLLTFSRAAVGELKRRVRAAGGDVAFVRAVTFDSFATRLLHEHAPGGPWASLGYDGRIEQATLLLGTNSEARRAVTAYRHVLVDELQDVVGVRDPFLREILGAASGGWTLLGDPAQGVYNFQLNDPEARRRGSAAFYEWVESEFAGTVHSHTLSKNFRVVDGRAESALWAGDLLNGRKPDYHAIREQLRTTFFRLRGGPPVRRLDTLPGTTAVLCPTNGQVLLVSRQLWEAGVSHRVQRSATDRVLPPWVAAALNAIEYGTIGRSAFEDIVGPALSQDADAPAVDDAWRLLKRMSPGVNRPLDIARILNQLRDAYAPDELTHTQQSALSVSTIHRAKGLEYDRVLIIDPELSRVSTTEGDEAAEEARLAYVAMTRPRRDLLRWPDPPDMKGMHADKRLEGRWARRRPYGSRLLEALEIRPGDSNAEDPAGWRSDEGASALQTYLRESVCAGDAVTFHLQASDGDYPHYEVRHGEYPIAETSEQFGRLLGRAIRGRPRGGWPTALSDVRVEGIETVIGTAAASERAGLGGPGVWLRARLFGRGELQYG